MRLAGLTKKIRSTTHVKHIESDFRLIVKNEKRNLRGELVK
jgi:hypothetical protein